MLVLGELITPPPPWLLCSLVIQHRHPQCMTILAQGQALHPILTSICVAEKGNFNVVPLRSLLDNVHETCGVGSDFAGNGGGKNSCGLVDSKGRRKKKQYWRSRSQRWRKEKQ